MQRLRVQGDGANALLSKAGTFAACTALVVERRVVVRIRTIGMDCGPRRHARSEIWRAMFAALVLKAFSTLLCAASWLWLGVFRACRLTGSVGYVLCECESAFIEVIHA